MLESINESVYQFSDEYNNIFLIKEVPDLLSENYEGELSQFKFKNYCNSSVCQIINKEERNTDDSENFKDSCEIQKEDCFDIISTENIYLESKNKFKKKGKKGKNPKHNKNLEKKLNLNKVNCLFPDCVKEYSSITALKNHIKNTHNNRKFDCESCGKSYSHPYALKYHVNKFHLKIFPFHCENRGCKKTFPTRSNYYSHQNHCKFI